MFTKLIFLSKIVRKKTGKPAKQTEEKLVLLF